MSTYSTNLKIELIGTGEQVGTWGTTTNSNFSNVFETSIVGRVTVNFATDANKTLSATDSVSAQDFRNVYLNLTSSGSLTATRDLIVPTINKNYIIQNNTTGGQSIRVITAAGTGITVPTGATCAVYVDGTNVIQAFDYLPIINIGTLDLTNLEVTNIKAKDGTSSMAIADSTGVVTFSAAPKISTLTSGRVTYATTSGQLTDSANLTFNGTTLTANTLNLTNALGVAYGGTGQTSLAAGAIAYGAGTSAHASLAIGTNGYILQSNGTAPTWVAASSVVGGAAGSDRQVQFNNSGALGASSTFVYDASGNLGIGTSSPSSILTIAKSGTTTPVLTFQTAGYNTNTYAAAELDFQTTGTAYTGKFIDVNITGTAVNKHDLRFYTNNGSASSVEAMRIDSSGNLLVGATSTVAEKLLVNGSSNTTAAIRLQNQGTNVGYLSTYAAFSGSGSSNDFTIASIGALNLIFGANGAERMRIDTSGNVGIGTSSISGRLTVSANNLSDGIVILGNDNANTKLRLTNSGTGGESYSLQVGQTSASNSTFVIRSNTASSDILFLNSSGNLGLGVAPSAWSGSGGSAIKAFQIANASSNGNINYIAAQGYNDEFYIGKNAYYNGTNWIANKTGYATQYYQASDGTHRWMLAGTTAGSAISFTQAMTLDASGNLIVGGTSPQFGYSGRGVVEINGSSASLLGFDVGGSPKGYLLHDGTNLAVSNTQAGYLGFSTSNTERMRLDSSGNLLVGTTTAAANLTVNPTTATTVGISSYTGNETAERTTISAFAGLALSSYQSTSGSPYTKTSDIVANADGTVPSQMRFWTKTSGSASASEKMRLDSSGNLGLGVTPSAWSTGKAIEVGALGNAIFGWSSSDISIASGAYYNGGWKWSATSSLGASHYEQYSGGHVWNIAAPVSHTAGNSVTFTQAMTLNSSGVLLVGTTTTTNNSRLSEKLALVTAGTTSYGGMSITNYGSGSADIQGLIDFNRSKGSVDGSMTIVANGDGLGATIWRGSDGTNFVDAASIKAVVDGVPGTNDMPGRLVFSTTADGASSATERMRIDSAGNLGLGVTPSAWNSGQRALEVGLDASGGGGYISNLASGGFLALTQNAYYNGTNYIRKNAESATNHFAQGGAYYWQQAGSSTAGSAISFTTAMTLDTSGNLLVGTTSAQYSAANRGSIEVNGSSESILGMSRGGSASAYLYSNSTDLRIVNVNNTPMQFWTNNTERMRIDSSGNVGIGTSSPDYKLVLSSAGATYLKVNNSSVGYNSWFGSDATGTIIVNDAAKPIQFQISTTEAMRIDSSRRLLVGTTTALNTAYNFNVYGTGGGAWVQAANGGDATIVAESKGSAWNFYGINSSGTNTFYVLANGDVRNTNNSYGAISDATLKENIVDATPKLDDLLKVKVRQFNFIGEDLKQLGVIAQEIEEIFPAIVESNIPMATEDNPSPQAIKSVKYSVFVPMLIKAVQELKAEVDSLKAQLNK